MGGLSVEQGGSESATRQEGTAWKTSNIRKKRRIQWELSLRAQIGMEEEIYEQKIKTFIHCGILSFMHSTKITQYISQIAPELSTLTKYLTYQGRHIIKQDITTEEACRTLHRNTKQEHLTPQ
jgi:hypothetical protein